MSYWITSDAMVKYYALATLSGDREVGGYAKYHIDKHGNIVITDLRVLRQESCEVTFEISAKENGLFLEQLVADKEDPGDWGMLFHTHPEGMDARMSGPDIKQITEMAKDLPGKVARSMILGQGRMDPMIHEAVCVEGRVFMKENARVKFLDTTGAQDMLKAIGWFDPPKKKEIVKQRTGFTADYAAGSRHTQRHFDPREGWYDSNPKETEVDPMTTAAYGGWLDDKWLLDEPDNEGDKGFDDDAASEYIGEWVVHRGVNMRVIDAYMWESDIVLILPDNSEVRLDDATFPAKADQAAS